MKVILQLLGGFFIFLIISVAIVIYNDLLSSELADFIKKTTEYLQPLFYLTAMGTFIVAAFQFKYNTNWNKRQLTIKMLYELKENLKEHFEFLHKVFKYRDLTEPIDCKIIHESMGIFLEDSNTTIADHNDNNIVNVSGKKFAYKEKNKELKTPHGKEINTKLKNFLNDLEAFSAAVNDGTFDEKQSKKLMRAVIVRAYKYFEPYILHLRKDHKEVSQTAYKELLILGKRWSKDNILNELKLKFSKNSIKS